MLLTISVSLMLLILVLIFTATFFVFFRIHRFIKITSIVKSLYLYVIIYIASSFFLFMIYNHGESICVLRDGGKYVKYFNYFIESFLDFELEFKLIVSFMFISFSAFGFTYIFNFILRKIYYFLAIEDDSSINNILLLHKMLLKFCILCIAKCFLLCSAVAISIMSAISESFGYYNLCTSDRYDHILIYMCLLSSLWIILTSMVMSFNTGFSLRTWLFDSIRKELYDYVISTIPKDHTPASSDVPPHKGRPKNENSAQDTQT